MNVNIDSNRPVVENGKIQLRLATLMVHPDYNLDKAFNGKGEIGPNRNEELDAMSLVDVLLDAKSAIEKLIDEGNQHWCKFYGYPGFMTDSWERAIQQGLVTDPVYARIDYIEGHTYRPGVECLSRRRVRLATTVRALPAGY